MSQQFPSEVLQVDAQNPCRALHMLGMPLLSDSMGDIMEAEGLPFIEINEV